MEQEQFLILFGKEEDRVVELEPSVSSYQGPTCLFLKQIHTSAKVQYTVLQIVLESLACDTCLQ